MKPVYILVFAAMLPQGHEAVIHLTITDEHPLCQAFVVIEALTKAPSA